MFKNFIIGRHFFVLDTENCGVSKINLRTVYLDKRFQDTTVENKSIQCLNNMIKEFDLDDLKIESTYDPLTGTFFKDIKLYNILYALYNYKQVETMFSNIVPKLYSLYESNNFLEFSKQIQEITIKVNNGKLTKKQAVKSISLSTSLDMLTNLDEDYCKYLVNKFLAKDEFVNLDSHERILTF